MARVASIVVFLALFAYMTMLGQAARHSKKEQNTSDSADDGTSHDGAELEVKVGEASSEPSGRVSFSMSLPKLPGASRPQSWKQGPPMPPMRPAPGRAHLRFGWDSWKPTTGLGMVRQENEAYDPIQDHLWESQTDDTEDAEDSKAGQEPGSEPCDDIGEAHGKLPERAPGQPMGHLTLVGAGPGDPDLLTVKAHKVLAAADLVVADRLVPQEILDLVKCELKVARKLPGCAKEGQREIFRWCGEALLAGKNVVRLKIGDPFVFGRGGEEVLEFRRIGVEATVLPGISSALAGPMSGGIPITHRGVANRVVFCTGMSKEETVPDVPVYHKDQTAVFLMGIGNLPKLTQALLDMEYPATTPVAIIERATTPLERTLRSDLQNIVEESTAAEMKAPAIIVVGGVVLALDPNQPALTGTAVDAMPEDIVAAARASLEDL